MERAQDAKYCWYIPGSYNILGPIQENGLTFYGKETAEQVLERNPDAVKRLFNDELISEMDANADRHFCSPPTEITKDDYWEYLEVLPPIRWRSRGGSESFMISEAMFDNIRAIYCEIGDRYFTLTDRDTLTHEQIVEKCKQAIPSLV